MGDQIWPPHMRLAFGGTIGNPAVETWSNTLRFHFGGLWAGVPVIGADPYEPDRDQLQDMCNELGGAVQDWVQNASALISNDAKASWCKFNWITADGSQRDVNTVVTDFTPVGGAIMEHPPWYQTYVITLRTALTRGRGHAGRIYPPLAGPHGLVAGSPYITPADATAMATAAAAFISSCATRISDVVDVPAAQVAHAVVISPGSHEKGTSPVAYDITGTEVDRVPDVMHSRTTQVPRAAPALVPLP
jgi:hypothetical protein